MPELNSHVHAGVQTEFSRQLVTKSDSAADDIARGRIQLALGARAAVTLNARSSLRVDVAYDLYRTNDWTWSTMLLCIDGTRVINDPHDGVYFVGVSYAYRWQ